MKKNMRIFALLFILAAVIAIVSTSCWPPEKTKAENPCVVAKQVKDSMIMGGDK